MQALAEEGKARYEKVTFKVVDLVCLLFILVYGFFFYVAIGLFIKYIWDDEIGWCCLHGRTIMLLMTKHMRRN